MRSGVREDGLTQVLVLVLVHQPGTFPLPVQNSGSLWPLLDLHNCFGGLTSVF